MKHLIILLPLILNLTTFSQSLNQSIIDSDGSQKLLGKITIDRIQKKPFKEWFNESYKGYSPEASLFSGTRLPDSVTIFLGTWCGDSQREVPRFIRLMDKLGYDKKKIGFIALDNNLQNYKQSPSGEEKGQNIHRVPTFILHEGSGDEIGRIVEHPVQSLEEDFRKIMTSGVYIPSYPVVANLINWSKDNGSLKNFDLIEARLSTYKEMVTNSYELNTFGYVLWFSFRLQEAEVVFKLNTLLFPSESFAHRNLARIRQILGKDKEALVSVKNGLDIDPNNTNLLKLQKELQVQ